LFRGNFCLNFVVNFTQTRVIGCAITSAYCSQTSSYFTK